MTVRELPGSPDLVELAAAARDAGEPVALFERPMPEATSVLGIGIAFQLFIEPAEGALKAASSHWTRD